MGVAHWCRCSWTESRHASSATPDAAWPALTNAHVAASRPTWWHAPAVDVVAYAPAPTADAVTYATTNAVAHAATHATANAYAAAHAVAHEAASIDAHVAAYDATWYAAA